MIEEYKGYQIKPHSKYPNNYVIAFAGKGGSIPAVFDTMFTSRGLARASIDDYIKRREDVIYASQTKSTRRSK